MAVVLSALMPATTAPALGASADEAATTDEVDRYVREFLDRHNIPGVGLAVVQNEEILHVKGYGYADGGIPVTSTTQFLTASVSKSFTATAVMQLVEDRTIDLDAEISTYLPDFPVETGDSPITIRSLLHQTSGLADTGFTPNARGQPRTLAEHVSSLDRAELVSEPGTAFHYTDLNYAVLARVVEVVSGQPFSSYLRDNIFSPFGMSDSLSVVTTDEIERLAPNLAQGHVQAFGVPLEHDELDGFVGGSGGVVSTAADMGRYLIAQLGGQGADRTTLVRDTSLRIMQTPPRHPDSTYAMGWVVGQTDHGTRVLQHSGVLSAFQAEVALLPDTGVGIALLYNHNYALTDYQGLTDGILALVQAETPGSGRVEAGLLGAGLALLALLTLSLQVRGLLRLRRWSQHNRSRQWWRLAPGMIWKFLPAALLAGLQPLVARFSGRVFTYEQLFWSMPDIVLWLALSAALGAALGMAHIAILARSRPHGRTMTAEVPR